MSFSSSRWLIAPCVVLTVLGQSSGRQTASIARDWKTNPAIVELTTAQDVYALGDIHGDYDRLVTLLVAARIISRDPPAPEKVSWSAGRSVLVTLGDAINKGNQSLAVLALLRALQADAARAGGRVVVLMGNHEARFLAGSRRDENSSLLVKELLARKVEPEAVTAGRDELGLGAFLRGLPFAARINDWFFSHAGNTHGRSLDELARELREGVTSKGFGAPILAAPTSLLEARLHPSPWWERSGEEKTAGQKRLAGYLKALGARHLVIGHQPAAVRFADGSTRRAGELCQRLDGLVFLTDVGMSRGVGYSTGALLHIHAGKVGRASAIFPDATTKVLWKGNKGER
jgi:hypothetical protein